MAVKGGGEVSYLGCTNVSPRCHGNFSSARCPRWRNQVKGTRSLCGGSDNRM